MSPGARRALIKTFEGEKLQAYRDLAGVWTIGYGHTSRVGPPVVRPGLKISATQADEILSRDLAWFEQGVSAALRRQCAACEFDALTALAYNIGLQALTSSTLLRAFNAGNTAAAGDAFLQWSRVKGQVIAGLARRRKAERDWFLHGAVDDTPSINGETVHKVDAPDRLGTRIVNRAKLAFSSARRSS